MGKQRRKTGDCLILTKRLGVGILCAANRVNQAPEGAMDQVIDSMTTLNRKASEIGRKYPVHACTDVTGFGFLGHIHEMMDGRHSCKIYANQLPVFDGAESCAEEFLLTAAGQKNRNHLEQYVRFENVSFGMEEVLYDPQTSGRTAVCSAGRGGGRTARRTAGGRTSGGDCRESDGERRHRDSGGRAQIET